VTQKRLLLLLTILALTTAAFSAQGVAQTEATAAPEADVAAPEPSDKARELLASLDETHGELVRLTTEAKTAEGEDLLVTRSRIDELARAQHRDLLALIDLLQTQQAVDAQTELLRQRVERSLGRSSRLLRGYLVTLQGILADEAAKRTDLPVNELQVFEHEMAEGTSRLDRYYLGLIELTDAMLAFGLDTEEEQAFLSRQLTERAQKLLSLLEITSSQLDEYKRLLKRSPDDSELQARVFAAEERFDSNKASLTATIQMMKDQGLDYTDLEVRTLEITGEVTPEALEVEVAVGLLERSYERARAFLIDNGPRILVRLLAILAILLLFWLLARIARSVTLRILDKTKISTSNLLKEMVVSMIGRVVFVIGIIVVLGQLGINLGPILAGLGIAGFIIGFALQDTLSNFAAGAMILAYQPYDIGDFVEAAGITGKVKDMNLVSTRILTVDHQTLIVPNSKIWGDVIRNVTAQPQRRVDMVFGISYEDEIPEAERVLLEIVRGHDKVLDDPEPIITVHTLNDSSVDFIVRPWARTEDYWDVYWDITREVKMRFDQEGISIPFPQRDVHLKGPEADTET
jgi:small conductance mechanosensitive channel